MTPSELRREMRSLGITPDDLASVSDLSAVQVKEYLRLEELESFLSRIATLARLNGWSNEELMASFSRKEQREIESAHAQYREGSSIDAAAVESALDAYLAVARE